MVWCPWLCASRQCLKFLNTSDLPRSKQIVRVAFPARLFARSLLFTPACPGQYTRREFWRWMLTIDTFQSGLPIPIWVAQFYTKSRSGSDERLVYWACTRSLFMHRHNQHPRSLTRALHQKVFTSTSWQVAGVDFYSSHPLFVGWLCVRCLKPG